MKIIKPSIEILTKIDRNQILKDLELIARTCYKSENKITDDSASKMIKTLIKNGHEAMIEHFSISVKIICDRGISHEIVRHRMASYAQESQRYCNYSKDKFKNEITFIEPSFRNDPNKQITTSIWLKWLDAMEYAEKRYFELLSLGCTPQEARSVLPNSTKTEIVMTANLREWRHFFKLRCAKESHPDMQIIANMIQNEFKLLLPEIFE